MRVNKSVYLASVVLLLVALLPLTAVARQGAGSAPIEEALLAELQSGGTANFLVDMEVQADLSAAHNMDWEARGEFVYNALREVAAATQAPVIAYAEKAGLDYSSFYVGNQVFIRGGDLAAAEGLAAIPGVAIVRLEQLRYIPDPLEQVDDVAVPEATVDWGITDTHADDVWSEYGVRGAGIKVANIDTGVQWNHPALVNQYACPGNPSDPDCWADPSNVCGGSACDNNGHGTHTMGTMVALDDPGLAYIAGMAPDATWIACKGCESYYCSDFALNTCADWIVAPGGDPANRPHVVNNSWGGGGNDPWYQGKVAAWQAAGVFPAFSAGNSSGCGSMGSPGDYQESFASTGHNVNRSHYYAQGPSAFGHEPYTKPNITAPAVSVCSSVPTNSWSCGYSGTSMASPHSAGAVALVWSGCPSYVGQMDMTFEILQDNADPPAPNPPGCGVPPDGEGTYEDGYGYLNALAAVEACIGGGEPTMHVHDIRTKYREQAGRYVVLSMIRVYDESNAPVDAASVGVEWTLPGGSDAQTEPTDAAGRAKFRVRSYDTGVYEICVTAITKAGYVYDPSQNNETCETISVP